MPEEILAGKIIHYYTNIGVGIIELEDSLSVGDKIHIKGSGADFEQAIDSIQVEHQNVSEAKAGDSIGVKLSGKVKEGDEVYKIA